MTEIELRAYATTQTEKRFRGKPFDWAKAATCIHLMRYQAAQMGHNMPVVPRFRTVRSAKRALQATGHEDIPSLLDSMFNRWPSPAFARTGDIVAAAGGDGFHGVMIRVNSTKFLGWHEDAVGCTIIDVDMNQIVGAWRL